MTGLGGLFKSIGGFPGIFLGASLLDMALKKRGGKGLASLLPLGVNPQTMETTDYQGDIHEAENFGPLSNQDVFAQPCLGITAIG